VTDAHFAAEMGDGTAQKSLHPAAPLSTPEGTVTPAGMEMSAQGGSRDILDSKTCSPGRIRTCDQGIMRNEQGPENKANPE